MLAKCNDMAVSLCHLVEQTKTVTMGSHLRPGMGSTSR